MQKIEYLGNIMRGKKVQHLIIEGKIIGKRSVGQRKTSWLKNLLEQQFRKWRLPILEDGL